MLLLEDKGREYKRYRPSVAEKSTLVSNGLQWVLSSNVSAIGTEGNDLIVRFINGSLYRYTNEAKSFRPMLKSNSKGHYLYVNLKKPGVKYSRAGTLSLPSDKDINDIDLFKNIENQAIRIQTPEVLTQRDIITNYESLVSFKLFDTVANINILK